MTATTLSSPPAATSSRLLAATLAGAGVDLVYASGMALAAGQSPLRPWQTVASGWIGRVAAMEGGAGAVALGLLTHVGIAAVMAAVWLLAAARAPILARRPFAMAFVYGLGLYLVMYLMVLPLRWPDAFPAWHGGRSWLDVLAHVGVALAIAAATRRRRAA